MECKKYDPSTGREVTEEIVDLFRTAGACRACRDAAIRSLWGTKRAIRFERCALEARENAWRLVHELHQGLPDELQYVPKDKMVYIVPKNNNIEKGE